MPAPITHVAVIGAGMAGLACARHLQAQGCDVTVFEKSRGPGGRCATRWTEWGAFHHGAPSFTARGEAFGAEVARWAAAGWVQAAAELEAWTGRPSLQRLALGLAEGLRLRPQRTVTGLVDTAAAGAPPAWKVATAEGGADEAAERFDAVVLAVPAEQAAPLAAPSAALQAAVAAVASEPCWTAMLAWPPGEGPQGPAALPASLPNSRAAGPQPIPLAKRVDASALPVQRDGAPEAVAAAAAAARWVLHATPAWTREHLEDSAAAVQAALWAAWAAVLPAGTPAPAWAVAHRWRYAQVPAPRAAPFGWDAVRRLGSCGDAWHGGPAATTAADGVERAWCSGTRLAQALLAPP